MRERPVGQTRDAGWQIGVSRTLPVDLDTLWDHLISPRGLEAWLGTGVGTPLVKGQRFETDDGVSGEIRSLRPHDRIRLTWQPSDRPDSATVQVAVASTKTGCVLRFHTERLYDQSEREAMRSHWRSVIAVIAEQLGCDASQQTN
jgi:uncharacterized protein YndB with AHSA1/START domain